LHKLRAAQLLPGELEFVQQAFKQLDDGSGYLTVGVGGSIHKWLARLNTTMKAETCQKAQEAVLGAILSRAPDDTRPPMTPLLQLISHAYSTMSVLTSRLLDRARRASKGGEDEAARDHGTSMSVQQAVHFYCVAKRSRALVELFAQAADTRSETGQPCMSKAAWLRLHLSALEVDDDALERVFSELDELSGESSQSQSQSQSQSKSRRSSRASQSGELSSYAGELFAGLLGRWSRVGTAAPPLRRGRTALRDLESPWRLRGAQFEMEVAALTRVFEQEAADRAFGSGRNPNTIPISLALTLTLALALTIALAQTLDSPSANPTLILTR